MDLLTIPFTLLSYISNPPQSLQQVLSSVYTFPPSLAQVFYTLGILWLSLQLFGFAVSWLRSLIRTAFWMSIIFLAVTAYTMGPDAVLGLLSALKQNAQNLATGSQMVGGAWQEDLPRRFMERMNGAGGAGGQAAAGGRYAYGGNR